MRGTASATIFLCLICSVAGLSSLTYDLAAYKNNTVPIQLLDVRNDSKLYLTSADKANVLVKITLTTRGQSITLDKLLSRIDDNGYQIGWPVYSDLTISTKNSENVTINLTGSLFICTPTQAQDPNFLVYVVRGTQTLNRSANDNTTIVFLNRYKTNNGTNPAMGFTHTRITNIVQPKTSRLGFYRGNPDDNYADLYNERKIFLNPLEISPSQQFFFDNIDPIQYSLHIWSMRAIGGIMLDVSDEYVDTTHIQTSAVTTTGMSNSQLFNYNSSVVFMSLGSDTASTGYMASTEMFGSQSIKLIMTSKSNGPDYLEMNGTNFFYEDIVSWSADDLQIYPTSRFAGIYWIQYFKIDNGLVPTSPASTTSSTAPSTALSTAPSTAAASTTPPSPSTVSSSFTTTASAPGVGSSTIQTTTQSAATSLSLISIAVANFMYLRV